MKKRWIIIIIGLLVAIGAYAGNSDPLEDRVEVMTVKAGVYKLVYKNNNYPNAQITIINNMGKEIHDEMINGRKDFIKSYDLSPMGSGSYTFKVKDKSGRLEKSVSFDKSECVNLYKVKFSQKVNLLMDNIWKNTVVKVYDESDQLLFEEDVRPNTRYQRLYDLSRLDANKVTFVITDEWGVIQQSSFKVASR